MKTKLTYLFLGLFLASFQVNAQHAVRFSPLSLVKNKAKLHYEYGGLNKMGIGVIAAGYYGGFPGVRVQPYFRYYITDESLQGLYVQPKFHFSQHTYDVTTTINGIENTTNHDLQEIGGSLSLGWQFAFGPNDNILLDIFSGYRHSNLHGKYEGVDSDMEETGEALYSVLHSSKFDLGLSVGFKF